MEEGDIDITVLNNDIYFNFKQIFMGTLIDGMKEIFASANQTNPAKIPTCANDGTPNGSITPANLATLVKADRKIEFIDMGLPSGRLWASKNIGAETITDYGAYFSWGNVQGQKPNGTTFSVGFGTGNDTEPYVSSEGAALTGDIPLQQDAANYYLGGSCRMPTTGEYAELFNGSYTKYIDAAGNEVTGTNKLVTLHGVTGIYLESRVNGNRIFFPCAGNGYGTSLYDAGACGLYWARSLASSTNGYNLHFNSGGVNPQNGNGRYVGFSVRAVQ